MTNKPNRYDQAVSDWFHSKTFKTLMTIALVLSGLFLLCVCAMVAISGGFLTILAQWVNSPY